LGAENKMVSVQILTDLGKQTGLKGTELKKFINEQRDLEREERNRLREEQDKQREEQNKQRDPEKELREYQRERRTKRTANLR